MAYRRLVKRGVLSYISPVVDFYEMVFVRRGSPATAFDLGRVAAYADVRCAGGSEEFMLAGEPGTVGSCCCRCRCGSRSAVTKQRQSSDERLRPLCRRF
ncbi:phenylalanine--tRNA ligase beta subunit-related protein [Streptomyces sp. NPDC015032]|uniref:phenylalanine--tRNA ligase beta subunit-related protein n=1 Tax=Streptomyces sp. NPDC015032 TaxID=3364937 RepID=UPI0037002E7B